MGYLRRDGPMRANVLLKAIIVGAVAMAFVVPLTMIWGIVKDRSRYRDQVISEVAASTARSQTLAGPLVVVRYRERIPATAGQAEQIRDGAEVLLPETLSIKSHARVETRKRGIHRVPVFRSTTGFVAAFTLPARLGIADQVQLVGEPQAEIVFGVSDPRGIRAVPTVTVNGKAMEAQPGAGLGWIQHGFSVPLTQGTTGPVAVEGTLEVIGTDKLMFL